MTPGTLIETHGDGVLVLGSLFDGDAMLVPACRNPQNNVNKRPGGRDPWMC